MTATIHKLSAGSGYDYLTRSVCCDDATGRKGQGLASYYSEKGDIPGRYIGSGVAGIDGIAVGDRVTAEHMKALFGVGIHPLAIERNRRFDATPLGHGPTLSERKAATYLGRPYPVYDTKPREFIIEVERRFHAHNRSAGRSYNAAIPADIRAEVRSDVAREFFAREHGRSPLDERELTAAIAKHTRPRANAVAGYDVTFSPVKSVSTLWAVADPSLAAKIEIAHNNAVADALKWLENHALFSREGPGGARQVDVTGLVATAFTHRDSRAGDPDLHTHVAIANKVQTLAGRWLSIDGRVLYKAMVSISETYNTALEKHLTESIGVRFAERPDTDTRKRPIREIVGIDPMLNEQFSKRRALIEDHRDALVRTFRADHGRQPTPTEAIELAQQANLETREAKHDARAITEQRATWTREAIEVLGGSEAIDRMIQEALAPTAHETARVSEQWLADTSAAIIQALQGSRAVWQYWHVYAEAQRQARAANLPSTEVDSAVEALTTRVLSQQSVALARPTDPAREPDELRRIDGTSVYRVAGSDLFTTTEILAAEERLVEAAGRPDGKVVDDQLVSVALLEATANGVTLNAGQAELVRQMATSGARVQLAIAPAGTGKTTAMQALAAAWKQGGGDVFGLAPSAVAADELHRQLRGDFIPTGGRHADTLAKLVHGINTGALPGWAQSIGRRSLLIIDEAGMADTVTLDTVVQFALDRGASVRLIGDDQQLAAIGAGGVLRDIQNIHGALRLTELMRFNNPTEGAASLALREGQPHALGFYLDNDRVHIGNQASMADEVFEAWQRDRQAGLTSLMLAPTRDLVSELNQRARQHRLSTHSGALSDATVQLGDGNKASVGDLVITRANDRRLMTTTSDWVKNGDRWEILAVIDGGVKVQHQSTRSCVYLPQEYVAHSVDLGYACTVHTAQGVTADTTHGLLTGQESRQQLYTLATRGRSANHLYIAASANGDLHNLIDPDVLHPPTATEVLESILARDGSAKSATTLQREAFEPAHQLFEAALAYTDAVAFAAEHAIGRERVQLIEDTLEDLHPGVSEDPVWPTLRAHLIRLDAGNVDAVEAAEIVIGNGRLSSAHDVAAVIDERLEQFDERPTRDRTPLPWLPVIPPRLSAHPKWGDYLRDRFDHVAALAREVRSHSAGQEPTRPWSAGSSLDPQLVGSIEVWRSATGVAKDDRRPLGPPVALGVAADWQHELSKRLGDTKDPEARQWREILTDQLPETRDDPYATQLAERLAAMARLGINPYAAIEHAASSGPLPDDHPAAALWWRVQSQLAPGDSERINANIERGIRGGDDQRPEHRWAGHAAAIDPRLPKDPRWAVTALLLRDASDYGYDIPNLLRTLTRDIPLGSEPAQDLFDRIAASVEQGVFTVNAPRSVTHPVISSTREPTPDISPSRDRGPSGPAI